MTEQADIEDSMERIGYAITDIQNARVTLAGTLVSNRIIDQLTNMELALNDKYEALRDKLNSLPEPEDHDDE